jgi:hypothetical protein
MTRTRRVGQAGVLLAVAVLLGLAGVLLGATRAQAQLVRAPYAATFENLVPGAGASTRLVLDVPVAATVRSATLTPSGRSGAFTWSAEVCDDAGSCVPVLDAVGRRLDAGTYHVDLAVVAGQDVRPAEQGSVAGRLVLVGEPQGLAATGAAPGLLLAVASGCAALGLVLAVGSRRRAGAS